MFLPFADNNPTRRTPVVTYALILANVLAFLWFAQLDEQGQLAVTYHYGFMPARVKQLQQNEVLLVPIGEPQLEQIGLFQVRPVQRVLPLPPNRGEILLSAFTCMFLHGGWMHLIGNMWFLFLFGNNIEDRLGPVIFPIFYLAGGLAATTAHYAMYHEGAESMVPVIGASGAVAAVLGAYAVLHPFARVHTLVFVFVVDLPALAVLGMWFLGQLMSFYGEVRMNINGGVAFLAHIGGFVAGAVAMPVLNALVPHPPPPPRLEEPETQFDERWPIDRW